MEKSQNMHGVAEKYDAQKDRDLLKLCNDVDDLLFLVFHLPETHTTLFVRIPTESKTMIESFTSFGIELNENPVVTRIDSLVELALAKNPVYPLIGDDSDGNNHSNGTGGLTDIFSYLSEAPYGVFGIKISPRSPKFIVNQYKSILKKKSNDKNHDSVHFDPNDSHAEKKSKCSIFFNAENLLWREKHIPDREL